MVCSCINFPWYYNLNKYMSTNFVCGTKISVSNPLNIKCQYNEKQDFVTLPGYTNVKNLYISKSIIITHKI